MTIQHIYNRKDVFVWLLTYAASPLLHVYEFLSFVFMPRIHFGKQTIITGLEATVLYGVAAHCNCIFYRIFLHDKFSLQISLE